MSQAWDLIQILGDEADMYEKLAACLEEKQPHLIKSEVDGIDRLVKIETDLLADLRRMEKQRLDLLRKWGASQGWSREDMTISKVMDRLEGEERENLGKLFERLGTVLERVAALTEENNRLIQESLQYIDFSINLLRPAQAGDEIYGPKGTTQKTQTKRLLDQQA